MQVAAQADPVHGLPGQGAAHVEPVGHRVLFGVSARREGGQAA